LKMRVIGGLGGVGLNGSHGFISFMVTMVLEEGVPEVSNANVERKKKK
jgi:hypothetical protein